MQAVSRNQIRSQTDIVTTLDTLHIWDTLNTPVHYRTLHVFKANCPSNEKLLRISHKGNLSALLESIYKKTVKVKVRGIFDNSIKLDIDLALVYYISLILYRSRHDFGGQELTHR